MEEFKFYQLEKIPQSFIEVTAEQKKKQYHLTGAMPNPASHSIYLRKSLQNINVKYPKIYQKMQPDITIFMIYMQVLSAMRTANFLIEYNMMSKSKSISFPENIKDYGNNTAVMFIFSSKMQR